MIDVNGKLIERKAQRVIARYHTVCYPSMDDAEFTLMMEDRNAIELAVLNDPEAGNWAKLAVIEKYQDRINSMLEFDM